MNKLKYEFDNKYFSKCVIEYEFDDYNYWSFKINDSLEMDSFNAPIYEKAFINLLDFLKNDISEFYLYDILVFGGGDLQLTKELFSYYSDYHSYDHIFLNVDLVDPLSAVIPNILSLNDSSLDSFMKSEDFNTIVCRYSCTYSAYKNSTVSKLKDPVDLIISDISDCSSVDDVSNEIYNLEYLNFLNERLANNGYLIIYCGAHGSEFKIKKSFLSESGFNILKIEDAGFGNMILAKKNMEIKK